MSWAEFWDDAYGALATVCGYDFARIDAMTLPEFETLCRYWERCPPAHVSLAAFLGTRRASPRVAARADDYAELFALLGQPPS